MHALAYPLIHYLSGHLRAGQTVIASGRPNKGMFADVPRGSWSAVVPVSRLVSSPLLAGAALLEQFGTGSHTAPASTFTVSARVTPSSSTAAPGALMSPGAPVTPSWCRSSRPLRGADGHSFSAPGARSRWAIYAPSATGVQRVVHAACAARRDGQGGTRRLGHADLAGRAGDRADRRRAHHRGTLTSPAAVLKSNAGGIRRDLPPLRRVRAHVDEHWRDHAQRARHGGVRSTRRCLCRREASSLCARTPRFAARRHRDFGPWQYSRSARPDDVWTGSFTWGGSG